MTIRTMAVAIAAALSLASPSIAQPQGKAVEPGQYVLPKDAKVVKGAFFITSGFRFKEYQQVAAKHDLVLIQFMGPVSARKALLARIAKEASRPEIEHANFIVWGHSAGGVGAAEAAAEAPERVIAACIIRSPNEKDEPRLKTPAAMLKVPVLLAPALRDGFVPVAAPTRLFERGRKDDAVWTLAVEPGGTHAPEGATGFAAAWLDAIIPLRLPADGDYRKGPVKLNAIDPAKGWLGNVRTFEIAAAAKHAGERIEAVWLPNEEVAKKWKLQVTATDKTPGRSPQGKGPEPKKPDAKGAGKVSADLEYAKIGQKALKLDLFVPEKGAGPFPLIVHIHGGAWAAGSYKGMPSNAMELVKNGYAVASIQYRLSGEAIFPAAIVDCKAAVRWLRANAAKHNLDPERFAAWGSSAGGHLVALLGTSGEAKEFEVGDNLGVSSKVQAVCDWYGPTDFLQMNAQAKAGAGSDLDHDGPKSPESRFVGGAIHENKEKCAAANPIAYASKDSPPFLIFHGDKDKSVPYGQSRLLEEALKKAGAEVALVTVSGAGHGGPAFAKPEITKRMLEFLDKNLKQ